MNHGSSGSLRSVYLANGHECTIDNKRDNKALIYPWTNLFLMLASSSRILEWGNIKAYLALLSYIKYWPDFKTGKNWRTFALSSISSSRVGSCVVFSC